MLSFSAAPALLHLLHMKAGSGRFQTRMATMATTTPPVKTPYMVALLPNAASIPDLDVACSVCSVCALTLARSSISPYKFCVGYFGAVSSTLSLGVVIVGTSFNVGVELWLSISTLGLDPSSQLQSPLLLATGPATGVVTGISEGAGML